LFGGLEHLKIETRLIDERVEGVTERMILLTEMNIYITTGIKKGESQWKISVTMLFIINV
jgi:hypothetical protein